jgi:type 2 lantibiotic biosynthesis protein LanM
MMQPPAHPDWWRALSLQERRRSTSLPQGQGSPATAARRLREWRSQSPFGKDQWFARRLALDGLDDSSLRAFLAEPDTSLRRRLPETPAWLAELHRIFSEPGGSRLCRLPVAGPLIARASDLIAEKLRAVAAAWPELFRDPADLAEQIVAVMISRVDDRISRAVVLEMRVAALRGELPGRDQTARFHQFINHLREPAEALRFLREYPVLARWLVESIDDWTSAATEFLERLSSDWPSIRQAFWPEREPGALTAIQTSVGDVHRGGREVSILHFGETERLVYKPRSLRIDLHFTRLLRWLEERGGLALRTPKILDRGEYGWSEFIHPASCSTRQEAGSFYRRQGALLAVLYAFNANDFHRENLIAAGEHPVPVDLETLFGPDHGQAQEGSYDSYAEFELRTSVVNTMLLPFFQQGQGGRAIEASGLGGRGGQLSINPVAEWEGAGTDEIRISLRRREMSEVANLPRLDGSPLNASDFAEEIEKGFTSMYRVLADHRQDLASLLPTIESDEVRVVFRATQLYSMLIEQSFHPDYLGDALDRDRLLDRLWFGIDRTELASVALRLLPSERLDLHRGEIPYFTACVGGHDLSDSRGTLLPGIFLRSGREMVELRLRQLGEEDLKRQVRYIRGSLSALALNEDTVFQPYPPVRDEVPQADPNRLLTQALKVADCIVDAALWRGDRASWIGLACGETAGWHLQPLRTDLYSGLPGLTLFLAYASAASGREDLKQVAEAALRTLRKQLERRRAGLEFLGGFDGWGGILYLWQHLFHLWRDAAFLDEAEGMLPRMAEIASQDEHLDVLQGSAGAIVPLLSLHGLTGSSQALGLARAIGNRLVGLAQPHDGGIGWIGAPFPIRPMTGFSHGASGFAWALGELYAVTGDDRYSRTVLQALAFERSHFSADAQNWADLRQAASRERPRYMIAWCHGACGIGLSRLRLRQHIADPMIEDDLKVAVETTYRDGFGANHSLCHGDLGNLELLLAASHVLSAAELADKLRERASQTLASIEQYGWRCGVPLDIKTPGLLDGLAGIGYGLLRLADPDRIPSVLTLEPPREERKKERS